MHVVVMHKVVERRQSEANPAEIFHQGLGVGGAVDSHDKAVAAEVRQFAELEEGHEAGSLSVGCKSCGWEYDGESLPRLHIARRLQNCLVEEDEHGLLAFLLGYETAEIGRASCRERV